MVCQTTELAAGTTRLSFADPRHYLRDLLSGNIGLGPLLAGASLAAFNGVQRLRRGTGYPGLALPDQKTSPHVSLDLAPGELVRVKTKREIEATLTSGSRNRGLWFDVEMLPFCGRVARVKQRVDHIINEKNGEMMHFSNPCIMLEEVACGGCLSRERLFCPRAIYSYWREIWLERVVPSEPKTSEIEELTTAGSA